MWHPKKMIGFLEKNPLPQRIMNGFNSGSYLIGALYPRRKVFIDGRTEIYGSEFLSLYNRVMEGNEEAFDEIDSQYDISG